MVYHRRASYDSAGGRNGGSVGHHPLTLTA
jgi:hypothetical protein